MKKIRVFKTESFRLAAWFAVLFLAMAAIFVYAMYWVVEDIQTDALVSTIDADISTINNGYTEDGLGEAIEIIQQRLGSADFSNVDLPGGYILLQDKNSGLIAGNMSPRPPRLGLFGLADPNNPGRKGEHSDDKKDSKNDSKSDKAYKPDKQSDKRRKRKPKFSSGSVLGRGVMLADGLYLYVGRDTATIVKTRERFMHAFAWISVVTVILAVLTGMLFSMQFMRRIDAIIKTCDAIVAGSFKDRIINVGDNNELDRLGKAINSMLDRIAMLLDNLRQVSSDIAHDLRTPLTHLRQRLESARDKSTTVADYTSAVHSAIGDTDQLLAIFSAILRISQIEAGTRSSMFATLSLSELLNRVYEMYRPVAEDQGHVLSSNIQTDIYLHGDAELLTQMVINIVENSLRHTPPGTQVSIALTTTDDKAMLVIADTGPGIAVEEREKVFRRFYRVSPSRNAPGNGLGLALVQAIADLHHAIISVADNDPGLRVAIAFDAVAKGS